MSSSELSAFSAPHRCSSLLSKRRPATSYTDDVYCDLGLRDALPAMINVDPRMSVWKEQPPSPFVGCDQVARPTHLETTTNNASTQVTHSCRSPGLHLTSLKQGLQSLGRRMSVSLRPKGDKPKVITSNLSHAATMSSDDPTQRNALHGKRKASKWLRSPSHARRQPSLPLLGQYTGADDPKYSFSSKLPLSTSRGPPLLPFDMHTGAAARAAAAAQNEALHYYQRQWPVLGPEMPQLSDLKLTRDSESGIGIEVQDLREPLITKIDVIREDPASVLPVELMEQILSYLDPQTLLQAERVCREWRIRAKSRHVWRHVFQREYDTDGGHGYQGWHCPQPARGVGNGARDQDWQKMYLVRRQIDKRWAEGRAAAIYLNGHKDSVYCVQFDEHKIITGSRDRTIRVWDAHTFQCLRKIGPPGHASSGASVSNASTLYPPGAFYIQNTSSVDPSGGFAPHDYHDASILCLQFDEEIMVTGSSDHTAIVWSIKDEYRPLCRLKGHTAGVLDVCIDQEYIVTCSKDTTICLWARNTGELIKKLTGHRGPVNAVQMRGNLLASASGDGMAKLWNLRDGLCVKEFSSRDRGLACVEFSEDGRSILAGGNDQVIYEYDANTGDLVRELIGHKGLVRSLHLDSSNNRIISGSYDMSVKVWSGRKGGDSSEGGLQINFQGWTTSWMLAAKSDYRKIVCTSQDGRVVIMDFGYGLDGAEILEA